MDFAKQTRFLTQNYPLLQGLRAVPSGLCLLVIALWANIQSGPTRDLTLPVLFSLVCLVFYVLVDQYYNRVYGKVKRATSHAELFLQIICAILALAAFIADSFGVTNVSLLGLVFAVLFAFTGFWYWRPATLLFAASLLLAGFLALLSLFPIVGTWDWWSPLGFKNSFLAFPFLFGVFSVICGVATHIYFIRSLPAAREAS